MTRPVPISLPKSEFNEFLFARIGEDKNGMSVSVLSGLARSDVDPWQEAANLAQLPGETAIQRLAALIGGALSDRASPYPDARTIAKSLLALLPGRLAVGGASENSNGLGALMKSRSWWVYVVFMSFMLGSQLLIASHQPPAKVGNVEVKDSVGASPVVPPVNSGQ
ncbi:MAG: hypothetical protein ABI561_09680 [Bradyrhizobium sp.]